MRLSNKRRAGERIRIEIEAFVLSQTHYGLMADFLRDVLQKDPTVHENLMNSAEHFVRMWEKAERRKGVVR